MFRSSKNFLAGIVMSYLSTIAFAQNNMSGLGNMNAMTGAMQGFAQGMRDADDRNRQIYEMNMRVYQANLDSYYQCMDLQLRARQQGVDVDMGCKKPKLPE
jgi:hypothetical protein